ncbi:hypothetical protein SBA5_590063 [Candidatus Sulfotelmatomonas gaucii]|uniref:Uncharacterized protein n=1 Tax=Candidatus Sulfuritelmatomonas gaucii TaxID=2043161 RepID=A0A2N9LVX0_9BACT|nr:hypothetical protein SBA5_590063 [Candidatus Sulfotelmatomonas gaucii]
MADSASNRGSAPERRLCANDAQKWNGSSVLYACNDGRQ